MIEIMAIQVCVAKRPGLRTAEAGQRGLRRRCEASGRDGEAEPRTAQCADTGPINPFIAPAEF
jgi:hypothetical protein